MNLGRNMYVDTITSPANKPVVCFKFLNSAEAYNGFAELRIYNHKHNSSKMIKKSRVKRGVLYVEKGK